MRTLISLAVLLAFVVVGRPASGTDVGEGNEALAKTFEAWKKAGPRLKASKAERRVMITGFGLFSGVDYNISGVVVESMADAGFWPAKAHIETLTLAKDAKVASGRLVEKDGGAKVWQRTLTIDGTSYEVGFLLLDVLWDLGAAITLFEAQTFDPQLIVMTGRGGREAIFESGALNRAAPYPGFLSNGDADQTNKPVTPSVIDPAALGVGDAVAMTWDNAALAKVATPLIHALGRDYAVLAAKKARPRNTYICNNISLAVLQGLGRRTVSLAGGKIKLEKIALPATAAGFFHYPAAATNEPAEILGWARMLATVVKTHFKNEG